jgi:hypothetical protein
MKIELKNIKHSPSLSEETEAFTANLYINGKHAGYAKNSGHGGSTDYGAINEEGRKLITEAEAFCKALPAKEYPDSKGIESFEVAMNLENFIDNLLYDHLKQKDIVRFNNQLNKAMQNAVVYGIPDHSFDTISYKITIEALLAHPKGPENLKQMIVKEVLPELKGEVIILNTNIPEKLLKEAGLQTNQYQIPGSGQELKSKPEKKPKPKL